MLDARGGAGGLDAAGLVDWAAAHPGSDCWLWLAAADLQALDFDPTLPLAANEREAYARGVFAHYVGAAAQSGGLALWHSGRSTLARAGAVLAPRLDLAALKSALQPHGVRLRGVQALWRLWLARALAASPELARAASATLAVVEGDALTLLGLRQGQLQSVRTQRLDAADPAALADALHGQAGPCWVIGQGLAGRPSREAPGTLLNDPSSAPPALPAGKCATRGVPEVDFLTQKTAASDARIGWGLAAASAVLLLLAGLDTLQAHGERHDAQAEFDRQARRAERRSPPATAVTPTATPAAGQDADTAAVPPSLHHPWGEVLAAVEGAGQRHLVRWLALEHSVSRAQVRLAGEVADPAALQRVAQHLARQPGWYAVQPTRLEWPRAASAAGAADRQPTATLRFELQARLATNNAGSTR